MHWDWFAILAVGIVVFFLSGILKKLDRVISLLESGNQQRSDANDSLRSIELDSEAIRQRD